MRSSRRRRGKPSHWLRSIGHLAVASARRPLWKQPRRQRSGNVAWITVARGLTVEVHGDEEELMDNINGKWALITGASSGLGVEFARLLAERKANLVLAARRKEPMEKLAEELPQENGGQVGVEEIDLSAPAAGGELKRR